MLKKLTSLLLAVCMLFCLSACGKTETSSNPTTNTLSESQTDTVEDNDENTFNKQNSQVTSNTEETNENESTQTQTQTNQSKPTNTTNQPTHTHSYSNATCTSPKKCSCGATAGTALGHQFSSATCTSPQICSRCGTTSGKALGHSYSAANCNSPKTCARCGQTSGSALGHNYVNNKCSRCGKVDPDSLPVSLETLPVIDKDDYWFSTDLLTDTYGNSYTTAHRFNGRNSYAIFNINNQYSKFTAKIVLANTVASNHKSTVNIYADNNLIYTVSDISKTTSAKSVNVNISNASTLKIEVISSSDWVHLERCCIVNAQLTK